MVDERLVAYVDGLLKRGYSKSAIIQQLVSHGYDRGTIDEAIHHASGGKHLNVPLVLGILGGIVAVGIVITLILIFFSRPEANIILSLSPTQQSLKEGETLAFTTRMTSTVDDPTSVNVRYDVLAESGLVQRETEDVTIRGELAQTTRIPLSVAVTTGTYDLRATITFSEKTETQSFTFAVEPGERPVETQSTVDLDQCPADCDDLNVCTSDTCVSGRCVYKPIEQCCGDGICEGKESALSCVDDCSARATSTKDVQEDAQEFALSNPQLAAQECAKIVLDYEHDNCLSTASEIAKDPQLCVPIINIERRDACYLQFALAGDSNICTNIVDSALQQTCFQYGRYAEYAERVA